MTHRKVWLVLPWAPSNQGGVTAVVQNIIAHWGTCENLAPALVVDNWDTLQPTVHPDALYFRFQAIGASSTGRRLLSVLRTPFTLWRTWRVLRDEQVASVNFHYTGASPWGVAFLKRLGLYRGNLVISFHGTDVRPPANIADRWLRAYCYRHADALVACSASLADRMSTTLCVPRGRITVIFNGADTAVFRTDAPSTNRLVGKLPDNYVVNIGAFKTGKAHTDLLEAFTLAFRDQPAYHLCLAGADGPTLEATRKQAESLGLASRVHFFVGLTREDIAHLLAKASLCVQPSLAESLPLSVLEAGAVGVPVAVSNIPGHDELVRDGETGRLFRVNDPMHCAEVMTEMLANSEETHRQASRLQQRVTESLTWEACVANYKALYSPCLTTPRGASD